MTTFYSLLISSQAAGLVWASLLFILCFLCVHVVKLAKIGYLQSKQPPPPEKKEPPPAEKPVYYLVERKRRKPNTNRDDRYCEPRKITFK